MTKAASKTWRLPAALVCLSALATSIAGAEQEKSDRICLTVDRNVLVDQNCFTDSSGACGPTSVANCLKLGTPEMSRAWESFVGADDATRLRFLIDRWFRSRPSIEFPEKKRFSFDGVLEEDLAAACHDLSSDLKLPKLKGAYLDRQPGESSRDFLARIHKSIASSLEAGCPPILSLKSYIARRRESLDDEVAWQFATHHWVVVTGVRRELRFTDLGFSVDLVDPNGGFETSAFIYAENQLNFRALKGTEEKGQWLSGRPYLLVQAPGVLSLRPHGATWKDRLVVTANFLISKDSL
ncbi:MAG: hypothetical protein KDN19_09095 [Verrucomicrobiae bacterium]|nr:hypothetical protein [Verrucomicrobiae bacterium]